MKIIAGTLRGRNIVLPAGKHTRPTLARVRQVMFDVLSHSNFLPQGIQGIRLLDVFAGSGSLGLEALSRGAVWAGFMENQPEAKQVLQKNIHHLGMTDCAEILDDALKPKSSLSPVDMVVFDAPYDRLELWPQSLFALQQTGWVSPETRIVCQLPKKARLDFPNALIRQKTLGVTRLDFYDAGAISATP